MKSKNITIGLLAHVDAGKTTLAENLLYKAGIINKIGRVDMGDTFLDTNIDEKKRGITIYSKQADFKINGMTISLLDTPGHVDFSADMERMLQVLDYAILILSSTELLQSHTRTLWKLLKLHKIPTIIFINKMDIAFLKEEEMISSLSKELRENFISCDEAILENKMEEIAVLEEKILNIYLEKNSVKKGDITRLFRERKFFPVVFGSALKFEGIENIWNLIGYVIEEKEYPEKFAAKVFKIDRDEKGNRQTYIKITGGKLSVKDNIKEYIDNEVLYEKVDQIRVYSGEKYRSYEEMTAGSICTVLGLKNTFCGQGLGEEKTNAEYILNPVMAYKLKILNMDNKLAYNILKGYEIEEPSLQLLWNETSKEIEIHIMGEIQKEILKNEFLSRYKIEVDFDEGNVIYKETIREKCIGLGHFEPLKHYAEVQIEMEPLERGKGLEFESEISEDRLAKNWQNLIITNLKEKKHKGVLVGAEITDIKFKLIDGKSHIKHTEGGDFRQASYRAVRQGLMGADNLLLEPYYKFLIELPMENYGKAITDLERMYAKIYEHNVDEDKVIIEGSCPYTTIIEYANEIRQYSHGLGKIKLEYDKYDVCHNPEDVIEKMHYDASTDYENTADSVFCSHGAGYIVPWYEVHEHMEIQKDKNLVEESILKIKTPRENQEVLISQEEIDKILQTSKNENGKNNKFKKRVERVEISGNKSHEKMTVKRKPCLIVDGYNIIFSWKELFELSKENMDAAREKLIDILSKYKGENDIEIILIFDAYKVVEGKENKIDYKGLTIIYTKEKQTADMYIEELTRKFIKDFDITVATSDNLEQITVFSAGARRISARELEEEVKISDKRLNENIDLINQKNKSLDNKIKL